VLQLDYQRLVQLHDRFRIAVIVASCHTMALSAAPQLKGDSAFAAVRVPFMRIHARPHAVQSMRSGLGAVLSGERESVEMIQAIAPQVLASSSPRHVR
jgi:hypothetical protein